MTQRETDRAADGWQPISTAPEGNEDTGPFFDVIWSGAQHRYLPVPMRAIDCYRHGDVVKMKHGYPSVVTVFSPQPTHWMPPPPPPPASAVKAPEINCTGHLPSGTGCGDCPRCRAWEDACEGEDRA